MDEKELLKIDIKNLKDAYNKIQEALNDLKDVDELDQEYKDLYYIGENINDEKMKKEIKLERLEEIA